jgi:Uma2 family endonuclease
MNALMQTLLPRHRIDVDQYYQLAEEGILAPDARVELIDGEIIDMPPIGPSHSAVLSRLAALFYRAVTAQGHVRIQLPVRLDRFSEPVPDLALLRARDDDYSRGHPSPAEALLLIEVSHSTLSFDRNMKIPLYGRHGIPEVWIVDIEGLRVQFFRSLGDGRYEDVQTTSSPGLVSPTMLPEITVDLKDLLRI